VLLEKLSNVKHFIHQGSFTVVNVRDNRDIPDFLHVV
jgi:hypothetical protein